MAYNPIWFHPGKVSRHASVIARANKYGKGVKEIRQYFTSAGDKFKGVPVYGTVFAVQKVKSKR
jgi:hypothetical protein